ncbi:MAG: protein kinase [Betaproteobacteria bacterium]|nr:protein kinase [Betaproteobacteria bacterium]
MNTEIPTSNPPPQQPPQCTGAAGPHISVIEGSIGYQRLLTSLIRAALPSAEIEGIDPFSQTMRGSGIAFGINSDVIVLGGIGTEAEAMSALQRLRTRESCPPIILLTSHELEPLSSRLCAAGAAAVLQKDALSQNVLADTISRLTGRSRDKESTAKACATHEPREFGHFVFSVASERVVLAVDGYQSVTTLSANPMAQVMLAEAIEDGTRVVVKFGLSTPVHDAAAVRQFCDRYMYFSSLKGRSAVHHLDAGIAGTWPYVVLEYLAAGDLRRRMLGRLSSNAAARILHQLAAALIDVHAGGFAHMDLKPENIFFRDDESLVLIDFNISTRMRDVTRIRTSDDVVGSPSYMSPEQGRGLPVDGRSDLYSAGVIFYEMLTGQMPFSGENSAQVIFKHLHEEVPLLPRQIRHLQPIVDRLLAKNPDERFANAFELLTALQPLLDQLPDPRGDAGDALVPSPH